MLLSSVPSVVFHFRKLHEEGSPLNSAVLINILLCVSINT